METYDIIAKIVVVGDSTVGKTCLILRYSQDVFRESFLSTIGVDFKTKTIVQDGKRIKLQLWDTAGQERFDSLRKGFYRGAKGVIVVYDTTRDISFRNVKKWLNDIAANTSERDCPVLAVLGNKSDLEDFRQVPRKEGEEIAKRVGATFGEVSAKTGNGMEEPFQEFVKQVILRIDRDAALSNLDTNSIDVSKDWTVRDESQCCMSRPRSRSSFGNEHFHDPKLET